MKPDLRRAPIELWHIASRYITELFNLFGAPEQIAMQRVFDKAARALLLPWLRAGEFLLRELLLIEAALLGAPAFAGAATAQVKRAGLKARAPILGKFHSVDPDDWRVSFCCFMDRRRPAGSAGRRGRRRSILPRSHFGSWGIALRCEALLRVFNNPARYAARLARRLYAKPARAARLLQTPPGAADLIGRVSCARVAAAAADAKLVFDSS